MNETVAVVAHVLCGFLGAYLHYFKKRYIDETTQCSLAQYIKCEWKQTKRTGWTIVTTQIPLAIVAFASGNAFTLNTIIGAITAGYAADSAVNKAPDA